VFPHGGCGYGAAVCCGSISLAEEAIREAVNPGGNIIVLPNLAVPFIARDMVNGTHFCPGFLSMLFSIVSGVLR